jgi:hypothetical protein
MSRHLTVREHDALDLLTRSHDTIKQLFQDYERLLNRPDVNERKAAIVGRICFELSIHAQLEDEIFYPAVRAVLGPDGWSSKFEGGHDGDRELIAMLDELEPEDSDYDPVVALLGAYIMLQIDDQQQELFPRVRQSGVDTASLGMQMMQRQKSLYEDVTRVGVPRSSSATASWPQACRVVIG